MISCLHIPVFCKSSKTNLVSGVNTYKQRTKVYVLKRTLPVVNVLKKRRRLDSFIYKLSVQIFSLGLFSVPIHPILRVTMYYHNLHLILLEAPNLRVWYPFVNEQNLIRVNSDVIHNDKNSTFTLTKDYYWYNRS